MRRTSGSRIQFSMSCDGNSTKSRGVDVPDSRILAIGDGVLTDIAGAMGEDIDSLFISGGLAARETKTVRQPDADALETYLQQEKSSPTFTIGNLR